MDQDLGHEGAAAAMKLRNGSTAIRVALMTVLALLLWLPGGWPLAPVWWAAYLLVQIAQGRAAARLERWGPGPLYAAGFVSFAVAGAPMWWLWTRGGDLGIAASTLFLSGMLVQLAVATLGARRLFWASATPLIGYLLLVPPLAFGPQRLAEAGGAFISSLIMIVYLAVLRRGQERVLERVEQSRREAEAASRAKTEFLAAMSHEIRTPMNAVLGAADLLGRTRLTRAQHEHVAMLQDGGAVLMQVLNDVLDLAKIEAGKLAIEKSDVDLRAVVTRCARFWEPRVRDAGLELALDIPPETPPYVRLDPIRVGQIVFNLLSNAVKFTAHGTITLKVEVENLGYGSHELVLSVRDTGIGIEPEAMDRLFTAFEQADGSITRRYGGTGLGLAIGQKLAAMMGGYISAVSSPGEGSTFFVRLPVGLCGPPAAEPADEQIEPAAIAASLRILVAEDNAANQRIIELFLKPIAAEVTLVRNGREAVEAAAVAVFDVILMDMQMPVMDGLQAARAIRASGGPNARVPILALTANVMESHRRACQEAGMDGHVAKPIDARVLMTSVMAAARPVEDAATDCALGAA